MKYILGIIVIILCVSAFFYGKSKAEIKYDKQEIVRYEKQIDTVYLEVEKIKEVIKEKKEERIVLKEKEIAIKYDSICNDIVGNLKAQLANCDETVIYKDRYISKLDTIIMYKDKIIEIPIKKVKPWGIGVQLGTTTDFKEVKPYVGVGVSYNVIRF